MTTFPELDYDRWQVTREALHLYSKLLSRIRGSLTPEQPAWEHISLQVGERGITTPPIPRPDAPDQTFSLGLDLTSHEVVIAVEEGLVHRYGFFNQRPRSLSTLVLDSLSRAGIAVEIDWDELEDNEVYSYNAAHAEAYLQVLQAANRVLGAFQATLPGETSQVNLWAHHFDLALVWYSGRPAPGDYGKAGAREQMTFGFSPGYEDDVEEAYFYVLAWPQPDGYTQAELPSEATWHTTGWTGAFLAYDAFRAAADPLDLLRRFYRQVFDHTEPLMT